VWREASPRSDCEALAPDETASLPPEVAAAEAVLDGLNRGDLAAALPFRGSPTWQAPGAKKPRRGGVLYRLLDRASRPAGRFLRLRVRIDEAGATRFANLLTGEEDGRIVVTDWTAL
jgi:hypothetical protein